MGDIRRGELGDWEEVARKRYKEMGIFKGVWRQVLFGRDQGLPFEARYFEIEPGGFTSLEKHAHPHAVMVVKGKGWVLLGKEAHPVKPWDLVFIEPWLIHQLHATHDIPLGFLCTVPSERDKPVEVDPEDLLRSGVSKEAATLLSKVTRLR